MMYFAISASYCLLALSLALGFFRLLRGPSALDRILAFDTLSIAIVGMIVTLSIQRGSFYYIEALLIFSLLGFSSTIAFLDYLLEARPDE